MKSVIEFRLYSFWHLNGLHIFIYQVILKESIQGDIHEALNKPMNSVLYCKVSHAIATVQQRQILIKAFIHNTTIF